MRPKKSNSWVWIVVGVLLICGCGGLIGGGAILVPVFLQARSQAVKSVCLSNMKKISGANLQYAVDNDDHLPIASNWHDELFKYAGSERVFVCPMVRRSGNGYAMEKALGGKKQSDIAKPHEAILFYETSNLVPNATGNAATEAPPNRHGQGRNVVFADGFAKWLGHSAATSP